MTHRHVHFIRHASEHPKVVFFYYFHDYKNEIEPLVSILLRTELLEIQN
jgi:hypothetical protein